MLESIADLTAELTEGAFGDLKCAVTVFNSASLTAVNRGHLISKCKYTYSSSRIVMIIIINNS